MQAALIGPAGQIILGTSGLTMGRMQSNQFVVYDRKVSAHHAVISSLQEGIYTITDRGSTNVPLVNGLVLSQNVPHLLHSGDTIRMGDTILTFQISNALQITSGGSKPFANFSPAWEGSATDRLIRVRYGHDENYLPEETQEKQAPPVPDYAVNNAWHSKSVWPSPKIDKNPILQRLQESPQRVVTSPTKGHRRIIVPLLLAGLILVGVSVFSVFGYMNYKNRSTPDRTLSNFCSSLQKKDYQSVYDQLSNKLQRLGTEQMIANNLSNVKGCTFKIAKESEHFAVAKINFTGLKGQLVSGTMMLVKDSNDTWKIDDLQNI